MSVCGALLVRDEADIVAWVLDHMLKNVDHLIVTDHLSTDGTREIIENMRSAGASITLHTKEDGGYFQSQFTTEMADEAREMGFDWIIPFDADEHWVAEDARPIRDWLLGIPPDIGVVKARVFHYIPSAEDPPLLSPFERIGWRLAEPSSLPKVGARLVPGLVVEAGNHGVHVTGEPPPLAAGGLRVNHYSWRSESQFAKKIQNGAQAYALTDLPPEVGPHWRMWGDPYAPDLATHAAAHFKRFFYADDPPRAPGSSDERGLVYDPAVFRRGEDEIMDEDQTNSWKEVHDDVEAALFAVNDLDAESFDGGPRIKAIVATKLEEAFLWVKRGMEKGGSA